MTDASLANCLRRARDAVEHATIADESPFAGADANAKERLGLDAGDAGARLSFWLSRSTGTRIGDDRYRWEISHKRCRPAAHIAPIEAWRPFRPDVEPDLARMEPRLSLPISIAETCEHLAKLVERGGELGEIAKTILDEAVPTFRRDLASYVQGAHPWADTFALFCLVRCPRALERLRPLALAIATVQAAAAGEDAVIGVRYPFADAPLASATAQLALGLLKLGLEIPRLSKLVGFVKASERASGAFGDGDTADDLLVTFACVELLSRTDPSFDPRRVSRWLVAAQRSDGFFSVLGPEALWLTAAIVELLEDLERPFAARFRWPQAQQANLDRKTGLPFYAYFDDLAELFGSLEGLAGVDTEVAFLDLARFREFNNRYGQDKGDAVLGAFAAALRELRDVAVIRDGGDEMLVVAAPTRTGLAADLDAFRRHWPTRFRDHFGDDAPPVAPRIMVARRRGNELRSAREELGRAIGGLKLQSKDVGPEGALAELVR